MGNEGVQRTKRLVEDIVNAMDMNRLETGIVLHDSTEDRGLIIRLDETNIEIDYKFLWFAQFNTNFDMDFKLQYWYLTSRVSVSGKKHDHIIPRDFNEKTMKDPNKSPYKARFFNTLKKGDRVLLVRILNGEKYIVLCKVVEFHDS